MQLLTRRELFWMMALASQTAKVATQFRLAHRGFLKPIGKGARSLDQRRTQGEAVGRNIGA